jgi:penicillin-binding protein 1A
VSDVLRWIIFFVFKNMVRSILYLLISSGVAILLMGVGLVAYIFPQLPSVEDVRDIQLQEPLRVFSRDGSLIAEFGEKRRTPVAVDQVPLKMKQAFIAAEDDRFYEHVGVDPAALARAALELLQTRKKKQGGSTITMQVARNFFLSPEKTYERKIKEVLLALIIERELSKEEILELYVNKIFLGHRAYGVGAAAQVYYGASLSELTLAQIATIAGLPKAPSRTNPISNPEASLERRKYVLGRMFKLGFISDLEFRNASIAAVSAKWHRQDVELEASHVAEMVRDHMFSRHGDLAYTQGFRVYTTLIDEFQKNATFSIRKGLFDYDIRHGYRGPENHISPAPENDDSNWKSVLQDYRPIGGLHPALIVGFSNQNVIARTLNYGLISIEREGYEWARRYLEVDKRGPTPKEPEQVFKVGDLVRVVWVGPNAGIGERESDSGGYWKLGQIPAVEGALISMSPENGKILALVGGLNFSRSKFNRVTQARRQPGSNFKPFLYSAALQKGFTAASFINDAPVVFQDNALDSVWRPGNFGGRYFGPTRLREALTKSRNLVSIRLLQSIGIDYTRSYASRFGFDERSLPTNLSMALGSGEVSPMEIATAYSVFANGGFKISPEFIEHIENSNGKRVWENKVASVCRVCETVDLDEEGEPDDLETLLKMETLPPAKIAQRVIEAENAWILNSIMQDVIAYGTGRKAKSLGRADLAGKTGTTNDQRDAWFSGFNSRLVTTVWVGFDKVAPLGKRETGAQAALPIWIDYMDGALEGMPNSFSERPPGITTVKIDPNTGLLAGANHPNAIFESFRLGKVPGSDGASPRGVEGSSSGEELIREKLF